MVLGEIIKSLNICDDSHIGMKTALKQWALELPPSYKLRKVL